MAAPDPAPGAPAPAGAPLLSVRDAEVAYGGGVVALHGVSLEVRANEAVALVGANGAGKTTLLKTIAGLLSPRRGEIWFDGKRIDHVEAPDRVQLGIALVPEGRRLFSRLSVAENLRLGTFRDRDPKRRQEMLVRLTLSSLEFHRHHDRGARLALARQVVRMSARLWLWRDTLRYHLSRNGRQRERLAQDQEVWREVLTRTSTGS